MLYSIIGIIICTITCIFTTFLKCEEVEQESPSDIYDYICKVKDEDKRNKNIKKYYDNFSIFFRLNGKKTFLELLIIPQILFFYINKYYYILIIKHLTPVHAILSFPAYYLLKKILLIINTLIYNHTFFDNVKQENYKVEKFLLDSFGDITSILGLLIYLEIIELNFCNFNYDLRKKIIKRGEIELFYISDQEEEDEENKLE